MRETRIRWLFMLTVLWGAAIFWIAPHPPMIDLPQHAGQVTLLRDLLLGQSPWSELFRINLFAPYLIGYGLALPLSLIMPVTTALKLLLSLAYVAFVFMCMTLRRHFGADPRLDWLFLVSFFGFAYRWGFFTFLIAASIGLWFILAADRYAQDRTLVRGIGVLSLGLLTLSSHGLIFLFALSVGVALLVARVPQPRRLLIPALPYALLVATCGVYFLINQQINVALETDPASASDVSWSFNWTRIPRAVIYTVANHKNGISILFLGGAVIAMVCIPWLLRLRIDWRHRGSWIPFATVATIFTFAPTFAFKTAFLYERFALFLLPAYAWMFTRAAPDDAPPSDRHRAAVSWAAPLLMALSWVVLGFNSVKTWRFAQESSDFDVIMETLQPKQRALALVLDPDSTTDMSSYVHYPVWYQAEKQGLTDTNFAWCPAMIVRFRPERLPAIIPGFEWRPDRFDWVKNRGDDYKYFFVRHSKPIPRDLFRGAGCPPSLVAARGNWTVFARTCS